MSIFINNIPVSINFFSPFTTSSKDKQLAVVLIQLDFKNRLIQRNWTFTLGLGLVLNNASSYDITMACDLLINVTLSVINVSFSAAFLKVFIQTIFLASN